MVQQYGLREQAEKIKAIADSRPPAGGETLRETQVRREVGQLGKAIEENGQRLNLLLGRLQSVLRLEAMDVSVREKEEQVVEFAQALRGLRYSVEDQTRSIMDALNLLEL